MAAAHVRPRRARDWPVASPRPTARRRSTRSCGKLRDDRRGTPAELGRARLVAPLWVAGDALQVAGTVAVLDDRVYFRLVGDAESGDHARADSIVGEGGGV